MSLFSKPTTLGLSKKLTVFYGTFICFATTTFVFSPNTSIFKELGNGAFVGYFIFPLLIAALLTSGTYALQSYGGKRLISLPHLEKNIFAFLYFFSTLSFVIFSFSPTFPPPLVVGAGALCGISVVPLCLQWAHYFSLLDYRNALLWSVLLCSGSALAGIAFTSMPLPIKTTFYIIFLTIGTFAPAFMQVKFPEIAPLSPDKTASEKHLAHPLSPSSNTTPKPETLATSNTNANPHVSDLISLLRLPAIGLLLYLFMMSITKYIAFDRFNSEHIGGCVAALCILPLFAIRTEKPLSSLVYRIIAPLIGGVVIVLSTFPATSGVHEIALSSVYVFLSALAILALAQIIAIMHAGEFPIVGIGGLLIALGCAVSLGGLIWVKFFGGLTDYTPIIFLLISLYCALMLISLGWETWTPLNKPEEESAQPASSPDSIIPEAINALLTKREREIVFYFGRGHSVIFIAEKLFISESTVRTHVKHIYTKLEIHSREELFALIDQRP